MSLRGRHLREAISLPCEAELPDPWQLPRLLCAAQTSHPGQGLEVCGTAQHGYGEPKPEMPQRGLKDFSKKSPCWF